MARRLPPGARLVIATPQPGQAARESVLLAPHGVDCVSAGDARAGRARGDCGGFRRQCAAEGAGRRARRRAAGAGRRFRFLRRRPGGRARGGVGAVGRAGQGFFPRHGAGAGEIGAGADRRAWFTAALCLAWPDGETATFLGRVEGTAIWPPRGVRGFGYDPIFVPLGGSQTYGEMEPAQKHATSHRARAFAQLIVACGGAGK